MHNPEMLITPCLPQFSVYGCIVEFLAFDSSRLNVTRPSSRANKVRLYTGKGGQAMIATKETKEREVVNQFSHRASPFQALTTGIGTASETCIAILYKLCLQY